MTIGKGKRPRDPNQFAKWIVDQSTSEGPSTEPEASMQAHNVPNNISEYMAKIGGKGRQIGCKRRLETVSDTKRRKIAIKAAKTRWAKNKKQSK